MTEKQTLQNRDRNRRRQKAASQIPRRSAIRKPRKKSSLGIWFFVTLFLCFVMWISGLLAFGKDLRQEEIIGNAYMNSKAQVGADTIIVLTGGSMRIERGLELLDGKIADNLFISGVYKGTEVRELLNLWKDNKDDLNCCIHLGYEAEDTEGNAKEVITWMQNNKFSSAYIVTANYHMKRALLIFSQKLALQGIDLTPVYVVPTDFNLEKWRSTKKMRKIVINEYHKFLYARLKFFLINLAS